MYVFTYLGLVSDLIPNLRSLFHWFLMLLWMGNKSVLCDSRARGNVDATPENCVFQEIPRHACGSMSCLCLVFVFCPPTRFICRAICVRPQMFLMCVCRFHGYTVRSGTTTPIFIFFPIWVHVQVGWHQSSHFHTRRFVNRNHSVPKQNTHTHSPPRRARQRQSLWAPPTENYMLEEIPWHAFRSTWDLRLDQVSCPPTRFMCRAICVRQEVLIVCIYRFHAYTVRIGTTTTIFIFPPIWLHDQVGWHLSFHLNTRCFVNMYHPVTKKNTQTEAIATVACNSVDTCAHHAMNIYIYFSESLHAHSDQCRVFLWFIYLRARSSGNEHVYE